MIPTLQLGAFGRGYKESTPALSTGFDPALAGTGWVISNSNRTATSFATGSSGANARTVKGATGKRYIEFLFEHLPNNSSAVWGVLLSSFGNGGIAGSAGTNSAGYQEGFGVARYNGSGPNSLPQAVVGNIIMMAVDSATGDVWWGINGTWFLGGDPAAGTNPTLTAPGLIGGPLYASVGLNVSGASGALNVQTTANSVAVDLVQTLPTGFTAWDD